MAWGSRPARTGAAGPGGGALTNAQIKAGYEANANTNALTDALLAVLQSVEQGATADQTGAEIIGLINGELGQMLWQNGGSAKALAIANKNADYQIVAEDEGDSIRLTGAVARTFTAPVIAGMVRAGWLVVIINASTAQLTLAAGAGATIDGSANLVLPPGEAVRIQVVGANEWTVIADTRMGAGSADGVITNLAFANSGAVTITRSVGAPLVVSMAAAVNALIAAAVIADGQIPASIARDNEVAAAYAALAGATFTGAVAGIDPTQPAHFATKRYVDAADANQHDSSSGGESSRDHQRISDLEAVTEELELRDHESWIDETAENQYAIAVLRSGTQITTDALPGYQWGLQQVMAESGDFILLLRTAAGRPTSAVRVRRTRGVATEDYRGGWRYAGLEQGGFDYYIRAAVPLVTNDVLTVQRGSVDAHTRYRGQVEALDEHAADWSAHQDSPRRQPTLGVSAPVGRRVYLTEDTSHPPAEQIFEVPLGRLVPNTIGGHPRFVGATVADFSGVDGLDAPEATADTSSFPGVMNINRLSGIWQDVRGGPGFLASTDIYLAIGFSGALAATAPTHLHLSGPRDVRAELEQVRITGPVNGVAQRIMKTRGVNLREHLEALINNLNPPVVTFSLQYPPANVNQPVRYLTSAGAFSLGTGHTIGEYESIGNGQWQPRGDGVIAALVAELATASDADKFALAAALHAAPEVLYTENAAAVKPEDTWHEIDLGRDIVAADLGKLMVMRWWNAEMDFEVEWSVRRFLTLNHQSKVGMAVRERPLAFACPDGDSDNINGGRVRVLYVSRPTEDPQGTDKLIVGTESFGDRANQDWRAFQISVELRSLL